MKFLFRVIGITSLLLHASPLKANELDDHAICFGQVVGVGMSKYMEGKAELFDEYLRIAVFGYVAYLTVTQKLYSAEQNHMVIIYIV